MKRHIANFLLGLAFHIFRAGSSLLGARVRVSHEQTISEEQLSLSQCKLIEGMM